MMRPSLSVAMMAAAMMGMQPAFPSSAPRRPPPPIVAQAKPRQKRVAERKRAERSARHMANLRHNDRERHAQRARTAEFRAAVNAMTNWQRCQWSRAGYPGLSDKNAEAVRPYAERVRPTPALFLAAALFGYEIREGIA